MLDIRPVNKTEFGNKRWIGPRDLRFAAQDAICPITLREMYKAVLGLPIGFVLQKEQPQPVALLGLKQGESLLVNDQGQWLGRYLPAAYRTFPFHLIQAQDDKLVLCFDVESGCLSEKEGEPFFDEAGDLTPATNRALKLLTEVYKDRQLTQQICSLLHRKELIKPWLIKVKNGDKESVIEGICRVDERALNELSNDDFEEIRKVGALPLIYSHLLSVQHLPSLIKLAERTAQQAVAVPDIDELFGEHKDQLFKF